MSHLVVVSAVLPFPGEAGQQQRVANTLLALREHFKITFLTSASANALESTRLGLLEHVDEAIVMPRVAGGLVNRILQRARAEAFRVRTGLKLSNYVVGEVELSPERVSSALAGRQFDCALFEYWHAFRASDMLRSQGVATILDTHDLLWQSYDRQLLAVGMPEAIRKWAVGRYRQAEESAWLSFDALIAISEGEWKAIRSRVPLSLPAYCVPMGIGLHKWKYAWQPAAPPRVLYYGGLSSRHNQEDAARCARGIMPRVWEKVPAAEFWIVGANPPPAVKDLAVDPRIRVTGYVEAVAGALASATVMLCPWTGTYGFRSRIVETMAVGTPVVASPDAIHGMGLTPGEGLALGESDEELAARCTELLTDPSLAEVMSQKARSEVEAKFSFEATYGQLPEILRRTADSAARASRQIPAPS